MLTGRATSTDFGHYRQLNLLLPCARSSARPISRRTCRRDGPRPWDAASSPAHHWRSLHRLRQPPPMRRIRPHNSDIPFPVSFCLRTKAPILGNGRKPSHPGNRNPPPRHHAHAAHVRHDQRRTIRYAKIRILAQNRRLTQSICHKIVTFLSPFCHHSQG